MILIAVMVVMLVLVIVGVLFAVCMLRSPLVKKNTRQNNEGPASPPTSEGQEQEMDHLLSCQEQNEASRVENELRQNGPIMTSQRSDGTHGDDDSTEDAHDRSAEGTSLKGGAHYDDETDGLLAAAGCSSAHGKTEEIAVGAPATLGEQTEEAGDMGREEMQVDARVRNDVISGDGEIEWKKDKDFPAGAPFHGDD
ncbi:uncharacterized protein [Diadema antillarum]|uniref:uncharacterized protein n=1 Tax=Diadema antillarum TaxID=105358 RepID=UPI003A8476A9